MGGVISLPIDNIKLKNKTFYYPEEKEIKAYKQINKWTLLEYAFLQFEISRELYWCLSQGLR